MASRVADQSGAAANVVIGCRPAVVAASSMSEWDTWPGRPAFGVSIQMGPLSSRAVSAPGWSGLRPKPVTAAADVGGHDLIRTTASTVLLTMTSPATILSFAAIFAGLGLAEAGDALSAAIVVVGVFLGSLGWWFFLSGGVAIARTRLPDSFVIWVSRLSGLVLIAFGIIAIGAAAKGLF